MPLRTLLLLTVVACLVAAAPSPAATRAFTVDVTGIHHVDWSFKDKDAGKECLSWSAGSGSHTVGFSTRRPGRYTLATVGARAIWIPERQPRDRITAARKVDDWKDHVPPGRCSPCAQEGGCDGQDEPPVPPKPTTDCRRRTLKGSINAAYFPDGLVPDVDDDALAPLGPSMQIQPLVFLGDTFARCYPDVGPRDLSIWSADPMAPVLRNVTLSRLGRGRALTRKASVEEHTHVSLENRRTTKPDCPGSLGGEGYHQCAVTDVTVRIRRVR